MKSIDRPYSQRITRYSYRFISETLIDEIVDQVQSHESVVLLGARGIGKQYVIPPVQERLAQLNPAYRFCRLRCEDLAHRSESSLVESIVGELQVAFPDLDWTIPRTMKSLHDRLLECLRAKRSRLVFLVSNIDALPEILARQLLKLFREFTHLGHDCPSTVTVLVTGSSDLAPLVYGANSEFHVREQIVVQGFSLDVFTQQIGRLSKVSGLHFEADTPEFFHCEVGGHYFLFRAVIDTLLDRRRSLGVDATQFISKHEIQSALSDLKTNLSAFRDVVIHPFARLESSSESLQAMRRLIRDKQYPLPLQGSTEPDVRNAELAVDLPTQLELCGVARRQGGQLVWASPLMQSGGESYFNAWTLGDAFACCNDWPRAVDCYYVAQLEGRLWSSSAADRPRLSAAIQSLVSRLFSIAGQPSEAVNRLRECCLETLPFLLGFEQVRWYAADPSHKAWRHLGAVPPPPCSVSPVIQPDICLSRLPVPSREQKDVIELKSGLAILELVVPLPGSDGRPDECVLMSNYQSELPIAGDRHTHAIAVGRALQLAYQNARLNEHVARQSKYRQQLLEALPSMFRGVGGPAARMKQALETAGEALRANGYRRVMFSMVDLRRRRINGVIDCRAPGEVDIAEMTSYPLDVPAGPDGKPVYKDIHQKVVLERQRIVVDDARSHSLTNRDVNEKTNLGGFVIFPLMQRGEVLGTMHAERSDRMPLDAEQVEALQYFADQVASAIDAMAWVDMLEGSTLEEPEAVVLIDEQWYVRYVNRSALKLFGRENIPLGWQDPAVPLFADAFLPAAICQVALRSSETDAAVSRYVKLDKGKYEAAVNAIPLKDWRELTTSFLIQVRDLHGWNQVVDSFGRFAKARDFDELGFEVLSAIRKLGHRWVRYYEYDEESKQLVGKRHLGEPEWLEDAETFQRNVLPKRRQSRSSWLCFERRGPVVFQYVQDRQWHGKEFQTPNGLIVQSIADPHCPEDFRKVIGEMWIDFPLMLPGSEQPLGKISLSSEPGMTLLEFEELRVLMEAAQTAFAAIAVRQEREAGLSIRLREMMLRAIGETCHHLKSKLASLVTFSERYKDVSSPAEIEELNRNFMKRMKTLEAVLDEAADGLKLVKANRERSCLGQFLRAVLDEAVGPKHHVFKLGTEEDGLPVGEFPADFDASLLQKAFEELIQNCRKALGQRQDLMMTVTLSTATRLGVGLCRIDVRDNGPGIAKEKLTEIFEEFFTEWPDPETRGTGLGLSYVQSVVAAHRGRIVAMESDCGAWFRIEFPRFKSQGQRAANTASRIDSGGTS